MIRRISQRIVLAADRLSETPACGLRIPWMFLVLAVAALALSSGARARQSSPGSNVVRPKVYVSLEPVPRGREFEIAVVGRVTRGFHVNAHLPSEDYLIPTRVTANLPSGITLVDTAYPEGVMHKFTFADKPLSVYQNAFTVRMKLRAAPGAPTGPQKIGLTLGYQACTEDTCYPPAKVSATAELEVAPAGAAAHPVHQEVFSAAPRK